MQQTNDGHQVLGPPCQCVSLPLAREVEVAPFQQAVLVVPKHVHPSLARVVIHVITFIASYTETLLGHRGVALISRLITLEYIRNQFLDVLGKRLSATLKRHKGLLHHLLPIAPIR